MKLRYAMVLAGGLALATAGRAASDSSSGDTNTEKGSTPTDAASTPKQDVKQDEKNTGDTASSSTSSMTPTTKHHRRWKAHAKRNASTAGTGSSADMKQGTSPTDAASTPKGDLKQDAKTTTDNAGTGSSMAHDTMKEPSESEDSRQAPDASPDTKTNDSSTRP